MPIKIFEKLLLEKIQIFRNSFNSVSKELFYDEETGKLIHPGEFGSYREKTVKDFISFFIPERLAIDQGFIINTSDEVSTQCDIVIYDSQSTPLVRSGKSQRFFPVETVCAVGEVKSTLSKTDFAKALVKLTNVKILKENIKNPSFIRRTHPGDFAPTTYPYDQTATFIICEKFDFDLNGITRMINECYPEDTPIRYRHNLVLSLKDGIILYRDSNNVTMMYPEIENTRLKNRFVYPDVNQDIHMKLFCSYIHMITLNASILYPEISDYLGDMTGGLQRDEP